MSTSRGNLIANRIARWGWNAEKQSPSGVSQTCGYCMSGFWGNFYQEYFFPNKTLDDDRLRKTIERLCRRGFYASLNITPMENGMGLYMYMRLRRI